jgi:hypothetical protein
MLDSGVVSGPTVLALTVKAGTIKTGLTAFGKGVVGTFKAKSTATLANPVHTATTELQQSGSCCERRSPLDDYHWTQEGVHKAGKSLLNRTAVNTTNAASQRWGFSAHETIGEAGMGAYAVGKAMNDMNEA